MDDHNTFHSETTQSSFKHPLSQTTKPIQISQHETWEKTTVCLTPMLAMFQDKE